MNMAIVINSASQRENAMVKNVEKISKSPIWPGDVPTPPIVIESVVLK